MRNVAALRDCFKGGTGSRGYLQSRSASSTNAPISYLSAFSRLAHRCGAPTGWSIARRRSQDPSRFCAISPVTPIGSLSRSAASLQLTTPASRSAGRIIASTVRTAGRRCDFTRRSSSGVSCCTCCPGASTASATTDSLPPLTAPRASPQPAHSSMPPHLTPTRKRRQMLHRTPRACCRTHARAVANA